MLLKNELEEQLQSVEGVNRCIICFSNGIPIDYTGDWSTPYQIYNTSYAGSVLYDALANLHKESFQYAIIENCKGTQIIAPIQPLNGKNKNLKIILCGIANKSARLRELIENTIECAKDIERIVSTENVQLSKPIIDDYDPSTLINLLKGNSKKLCDRINEVREMEKNYFLRGYSENVKLEFDEIIRKSIESIPFLKSLIIALKNGYVIKKYGKEGSIQENDIESLSEKARLFICSANNWSILKDDAKITSCFLEYDTFYHYIYSLSRSRVDFVLEKMNVKAKIFEQIFEEYEINSMKLERFAEKINSLVKYAQIPFGNLKWLKKSTNGKEKSIINVL